MFTCQLIIFNFIAEAALGADPYFGCDLPVAVALFDKLRSQITCGLQTALFLPACRRRATAPPEPTPWECPNRDTCIRAATSSSCRGRPGRPPQGSVSWGCRSKKGSRSARVARTYRFGYLGRFSYLYTQILRLHVSSNPAGSVAPCCWLTFASTGLAGPPFIKSIHPSTH